MPRLTPGSASPRSAAMSQNRPSPPRTANRLRWCAAQVVARLEPRPAPRDRCRNSSLPMASSCSSGQRSVVPLTKPMAWSASRLPSLSKSASLASQPQPLRERPERLALVDVGGDARAASGRVSPVLRKTKWLSSRAILGGDVADEEVEEAVAVQVAEVDAHALERVAAEHLGVRRGERLARPRAGRSGTAPGVDRLCSSRSGPKSLAK